MWKVCKGCKKPNDYPLNKFCKDCHYNPEINVKLNAKVTQSTIQRSAVKPISNKRKKRLAEWGWESPVCERVYEFYKARCILTNQRILEPKPWCFPHLLSKWMFPHLRVFRNNIVLVANEQLHWDVDRAINKLKREIGIKELEARIIRWEDIAPDVKRIYDSMKHQ